MLCIHYLYNVYYVKNVINVNAYTQVMYETVPLLHTVKYFKLKTCNIPARTERGSVVMVKKLTYADVGYISFPSI